MARNIAPLDAQRATRGIRRGATALLGRVDGRELLGTCGGVIITLSALYYLLDVLRGGTRPQRTSWLLWALTGVLGFGTADDGGAGPGAYAAGVDAIACVVTFVLCLFPRYGKPGGRRSDLLLAVVAIAAICLWRWGSMPTTWAAVLAVSIDTVALWPTLREAWLQPGLESRLSWAVDVLGTGLCLAAVARLDPAAVLYPAFLVGAAASVSLVLLLRGRDVSQPADRPSAARTVFGPTAATAWVPVAVRPRPTVRDDRVDAVSERA